MKERSAHWQDVYTTRADSEVSWYEESPALSLDLLEEAGMAQRMSVIDVGGGASRLVDSLVERYDGDVTVLDLSQAALDIACKRLPESARVHWVAGDVTCWHPDRVHDFWHDRAAFHFLTAPEDQSAYVDVLRRALKPGGVAVIGTFAPDGPEKCSGLPVARHDAETMKAVLGKDFTLMAQRRHVHVTPWGSSQNFQFCTFRRA